jgi:plastocyanin
VVKVLDGAAAAGAGRTGRGGLRWRGLVAVAAAGHVLVLLLQGVVLGDREALGLAVVTLVGIALLRARTGLLGLLTLGALFLNTQLWMFPAATAIASHRSGLGNLVVPAVLLILSAAGLVGVVAALARRRAPDPGRGVAAGAGALAAVFVLTHLALVPVMMPASPQRIPPGVLMIQSRNVAFSPDSPAVPSGKVTVAMRNRDLFWHTFTIRALRVDLKVPVGSVRSFTFDARPGTYRFSCRIPGHAAAGMRGTLTVR